MRIFKHKLTLFTTKGPWLILAAAMLWGTTGTSQALAPVGSSPAAIAALRMLLGGAALTVCALLRGGLRIRSWPVLLPLFAGGLIALYQFSIFWAMAETGVAVGTTVGMGSAPVFAGNLEYFVKGRRPERRWYLSTSLAILGCLLLLLKSGDLHVDNFGVFLALIASFSYAFYTLLISILMKGRSSEDVTAVVTCIGALFLLPVLFKTNLEWLGQVNGWLLMLHLGLLATALSYWLFARGLATVPVSTAVTLSLAEPLVATVLGVLVVGERLNITIAFGLVLIFSALLLLVLPVRFDFIAGLQKKDEMCNS